VIDVAAALADDCVGEAEKPDVDALGGFRRYAPTVAEATISELSFMFLIIKWWTPSVRFVTKNC
jgi:hypothetical protein